LERKGKTKDNAVSPGSTTLFGNRNTPSISTMRGHSQVLNQKGWKRLQEKKKGNGVGGKKQAKKRSF